MTDEKEWNFEKSFARLEQILEKMNKGNVSLDESLQLYEEADRLIGFCTTRLTSAETRIETLIKKRNGELSLDPDGQPLTQAFHFQEVGSDT